MPIETIRINDDTFRFEFGMVRSLLFAGSEKAALVDTGFGAQDGVSLRDIVAAVTDKPVMLIVTHADGDHTGGNAEFDAAYMHPAEYAHYHARNQSAPVKPLWDGDVIDLGGRALEVLHLPGHTPGSIALLDRANRSVVTGDCLSSGAVFMFGEQRNLPAYIESMRRLDAMRDAFDTIYPSHGEFPLAPEHIRASITAAEKLLAGELTGEDSAFPGNAKVFSYGGASFLY